MIQTPGFFSPVTLKYVLVNKIRYRDLKLVYLINAVL